MKRPREQAGAGCEGKAASVDWLYAGGAASVQLTTSLVLANLKMVENDHGH